MIDAAFLNNQTRKMCPLLRPAQDLHRLLNKHLTVHHHHYNKIIIRVSVTSLNYSILTCNVQALDDCLNATYYQQLNEHVFETLKLHWKKDTCDCAIPCNEIVTSFVLLFAPVIVHKQSH